MKNATYTKSGMQFIVYIKDTDSRDNDFSFLGVFPTFQEAVDFRKDYLIEAFDLDGEELDEEIENTFGGNSQDWVLDDGHQQINIDEVPVYSK